MKLDYLVCACVSDAVGFFELNCASEDEVIAYVQVQRQEKRKIRDQILTYCVNIYYEYIIAYLCDSVPTFHT
jgi:hypothetical protein